ncbi:hypothetical protein E2562_026601 [Oryza meyeriana var. granulata]|uniref:Enolpyruvate transferase domain-containing protein n=1 Tax=Oryza meyeriana var. granulata TaxID=110450 RepID=A0A6G1CRT3_9ORYZ|nr:hypothetical protein E2562_026601 [Oryza meyeriana var. granulata]
MAAATATMASKAAAVSLDRASAASAFSRQLRLPAAPRGGMRMRVRGRRAVVAASSSVAAPAAKAEEEIVLQPIREISGAVQLPGSKSLSNRILLLSALSELRLKKGRTTAASPHQRSLMSWQSTPTMTHRMAMAFSLTAGADVPVTIRDPGCTRKTFPNYFDMLSTFVKN